jgi:hypothetical protein
MAATRRGQGIDCIEYAVESAAEPAVIRPTLYRRGVRARYDGHHAPADEGARPKAPGGGVRATRVLMDADKLL